ncbi:MAG: serpin family protein [Planctomycetota bacterium]
MMTTARTLTRFTLAVGALTLAATSLITPARPALADDPPAAPAPVPAADDVTTLVNGNTAFALDLYHQLRRTSRSGDSFFSSPYSISAALTMTAAGAKGDTATEMRRVLHQSSLTDPRVEAAWKTMTDRLLAAPSRVDRSGEEAKLEIANQLWGQDMSKLPGGREFQREFLDRLERAFRAPLQTCDFVSDPQGERVRINKWVAEHTNDRIKDLLSPDHITETTRLVLTNAIFFKAGWKVAFSPAATRDASFTTVDGTTSTVPMMHQSEMMRYATGDGFVYVELPCVNTAAAVGLIIPDAGKFADVEARLTPELLAATLKKAEWQEVNLALPRFRRESKFELSNALQALGMRKAFTREADFSGMDGTHLMLISAVIHQTFINVDEKGTEAAAATAVVMSDGGMPPQPVDVTVDRPFMHLIRDGRTGTIMFLGREMNPAAK